IDDMLIPSDKYKLVENAEKEVVKVQQQYLDGAITNGERYNKVIALWGDITERVADEMFKALENQDKEGNINPVYVMADSGERDCGTSDGIFVEPIVEAGVEVEPLRDRIVGRVSLDKIKDFEGTVIVDVSQEITEELANQVQGAGIERVRIRSVLTCESRRGV